MEWSPRVASEPHGRLAAISRRSDRKHSMNHHNRMLALLSKPDVKAINAHLRPAKLEPAFPDLWPWL
jgi:hypothetical protein